MARFENAAQAAEFLAASGVARGSEEEQEAFRVLAQTRGGSAHWLAMALINFAEDHSAIGLDTTSLGCTAATILYQLVIGDGTSIAATGTPLSQGRVHAAMRASGGTPAISERELILEARGLRAEFEGENPEYDRALVELVNRCRGRTADEIDDTRIKVLGQRPDWHASSEEVEV